MQQKNSIKIDGKEFLVKELTVKELLFICVKVGWIPSRPEVDIPIGDKPLYEVVLSFASDMKVSDLVILAPSDIKKIYDLFIEVNRVTFDILEYLDLKKMVEELKNTLVSGFISDYSTLLKTVQKEVSNAGDGRKRIAVKK